VDIKDKVGPLIKEDFLCQDIFRVSEWFSTFEDAALILEKELHEAPLKYALRENLWLSAVFLMRYPGLYKKNLQIQVGMENSHQICPLLIRSHIHNHQDTKSELLQFLHDRVRL
jgi:hypothetical protein